MQSWELLLPLSDSFEPLSLRLARAITEDIRRGRLRPGQTMPGSRTLSHTLKVHRNTVLEAYRELLAEGWLVTQKARGTFVSEKLPEVKPKKFAEEVTALPERPPYSLGPGVAAYHRPVYPPGTLLLTGGFPDLRLLPGSALSRAYRRALEANHRSSLNYGDSRGHPKLREALATMLASTRGVTLTRDSLLVTRGSQMALYLAARTLLQPGDQVAVESFGYRPAWEALRAAGAHLCPVPIDQSGLSIDALEKLLTKKTLRAVYVTPHHQYPTTATLTADRRLRLLALAKAHRFAIIEDDYDHEFHYEGRPILPLASADTHGSVIYIGTLSKAFAPGLRIGYLSAHPMLLERANTYRVLVDRQGDHVAERAVAEILEDGELGRHIRRVKRLYQSRRDALYDALSSSFGQKLSLQKPSGGIALWAKVSPEIDVNAWAERALRLGVAFHRGSFFDFEGRNISSIRAGFAAHTEEELQLAVKKMATALNARR